MTTQDTSGEVFAYMIKIFGANLLSFFVEGEKEVRRYVQPPPHLSFYTIQNSKSPPSTEKWARASFNRARSSLPFWVETLLLEVFLFTRLSSKFH
jgi:hypothetical protein